MPFNLREGSDSDRNAAILSVGALGSGKTTLAQKLEYEAFLQGARVIDCDPKGDHRFHLLPEVAPHVEASTLRGEPALRGMLDPLRVAPEHLRHDAAVSFLCDLLPARAEPAWETAVAGAVDRVLPRSRAAHLPRGGARARRGRRRRPAGRRRSTARARRLTQLGFADPDVRLPAVGTSAGHLPADPRPAGPQPACRARSTHRPSASASRSCG